MNRKFFVQAVMLASLIATGAGVFAQATEPSSQEKIMNFFVRPAAETSAKSQLYQRKTC